MLFAAFFNFVAIFVFHLSVAATVGKGIVDPGVVDHHVVFGALIGAITWNVDHLVLRHPGSSSHALIGGIVGAVIAKAGTGALIAAGICKTVLFIFVSPLLGFLLGSLMMVLVSACSAAPRRSRVDRWFRRLQLVSAGAYSLGHGGNDAQKTIGIIWMLLIATGYVGGRAQRAADLGDRQLLRRDRAWAPCSAAGASSRPWARRSPSSSRWAASAPRPAARSRCSSPPRWASRSRPRTPSPAPSSASARRSARSAVRWGVAGNIVWAWIFTIPASAFVAARVLLDQPQAASLATNVPGARSSK